MAELMRFKDALESNGSLSTEDRLKELMEPESYQDLVDAIHDPKVSAGAIQRALMKMGYEVSRSGISRWKQNVKVS
jgi:hypothetical protein